MDFIRQLRPYRLFLLILVLSLVTRLTGSSQLLTDSSVSAGDDHFGRGEFTAALASYEEANAAYPNQGPILLRLGEAREALHRWEEARSAYGSASRFPWTEARAWAGLAGVATAQGDAIEASSLWEQAVKLGPRDPAVLLLYIRFLWQNGDFDQASIWLKQVLRLAPENAEAHYRAGVVSLLNGEIETAETDLKAAAQDADGDVSAKAKAVLVALGNWTQANSAQSLLSAGTALLGTGELKAARTLLQKAQTVAPDSPVAGAYLGYTLVQDGEEGAGEEMLREVAAQAPDYPLVWYFLGESERMAGRMVEARADYEHVLQLDLENGGACVAMAQTYIAEDAFSEAETWLQKAVELSPGNGDFWLALAQFYVGRLSDVAGNGIAAAQKAVELLPESAAAYDVLGWAHFLSGDTTDAQQELERAAQLNDALPSVHYHLGSLYYATGYGDLARYHLIRTVDLEPDGRYASLAQDLLLRLPD